MNQYLLFFIGMALLVMAPGPDFINVVGQSLRGSFRNGLMSAVGVGAGLCVHVTAAILGLSAILLSSASAYEAVRWAGAAYLVLLGIRSLFSRSTGESSNLSGHALSNRPVNRAFRKGFLVKAGFGCNSLCSGLSPSSLPAHGSAVLPLLCILPGRKSAKTERFGKFKRR
jgi:threonine/homoserine/homoserine lactone efflux protein